MQFAGKSLSCYRVLARLRGIFSSFCSSSLFRVGSLIYGPETSWTQQSQDVPKPANNHGLREQKNKYDIRFFFLKCVFKMVE